MTTTIDQPGLAKVSRQTGGEIQNRVRILKNERQRIAKRLAKAQAQFNGIVALEDFLPRYLQPGDYEHLREILSRNLERLREAYDDNGKQLHDAQHRERERMVEMVRARLPSRL
jgi:hypothetical protein